MHTLAQLEKQQVGLRLPKYLVDDIDAFTKEYSLNRTDIITEAIQTYVKEQNAKIFYDSFEDTCQTLKKAVDDEKTRDSLQTLDELINELEDH